MEAVRKRKSPPLGKRTWTPEDENYLAEKWGYASVPAIAKKLNRTENAVVVRAQRLGLGAVLMAGGYVTLNQLLATVTGRERGNTYQRKSWVENRGLPVHRKKVNRCSFSVVYLEEFWKWAEHNRSFLDFSKMEPLALGKSEKAVRGKVYTVYLTESADKVREYMGDGPWGAGAPEPKVKQAVHLSTTRTEVRKQLSYLAGLLRKRANDLGYDPYWQRFMCQHWDDFGGCSAGCANCDDCTEFRRIRPQYCARCGGTFYERKENRFCGACRTARKKKAQRHWYRVNHS
nr:MAG TPA: Protein of unknown function (DUF1272) [Bacteriophage sp.]